MRLNKIKCHCTITTWRQTQTILSHAFWSNLYNQVSALVTQRDMSSHVTLSHVTRHSFAGKIMLWQFESNTCASITTAVEKNITLLIANRWSVACSRLHCTAAWLAQGGDVVLQIAMFIFCPIHDFHNNDFCVGGRGQIRHKTSG